MRRSYSSQESGQGLIEYALILVVLTAGFVCLLVALLSKPDLLDKGAIVAVIAALLGGITWVVKQTLRAATNRAQLRILEALNSKSLLTKTEIQKLLAKDHFLFWLLPEIDSDALSNLVFADKIVIVGDGIYALPQSEKSTNKAQHNNMQSASSGN